MDINMNRNSLFQKVKELFASEEPIINDEVTQIEEVSLDVKTDDDRILRILSKDLELEAEIKEVTEEGVVDLADGTYNLVDYSTIEVEGGKIVKIEEKEADGSVETEEVADESKTESFKAEKLKVENFAVVKEVYEYEIKTVQDTFEIGTVVTVIRKYEGEETEENLSAGAYVLEDKRTIVLDENGVVILIKDENGVAVDSVAIGEETEDEVTVEETPEVVEEVTEEEFASVINELTEKYSKMKEDYKALYEEFEAFKKESSVNHTLISDTISFNENKKSVSKLRAQLGKY